MIRGREALRILVVSGIAVAAAGACALPTLLRSGIAPAPTPLALSRCDVSSGIVCVVTFGVEPPDKMLVAILVPLGGFQEIHVDVGYRGTKTAYPCQTSVGFPRNFNCTGPSIPLGSTIRIDVLTGKGVTLLASGEFVLTALALPTVGVVTLPAPGTAYPNP
jgi:hypothetical protein